MKRLNREVALLLACVLSTSTAWADTVTIMDPFSSGTTTRFPTPLPSNGQATTFTTFSGSAVPYIMRPFTVQRAGTVTAVLSGLSNSNNPVAVGAFFVLGPFSPNASADPSTPLGNFIVGQQGFPSTTIFADLSPGVQYTYLLLFSSGQTGISTLTLTSPGCISVLTPCAAFVPNSTRVTGNVAELLDAIAGTAPTDLSDAIADLSSLGNAEQSAALERLVPVPAQSLMVASRESMQGAFDRMSGRLDALRIAGNAARIDPRTGLAEVASRGERPSTGLWLNTYGLTSRESQHKGFAGFRSHGWGVTVGADRLLANGMTAGVALSYSDTDLSFHNQRSGDQSDVRSHQISIYGSRDFGAAYIDGMLAYSLQRYDSRRNTTVSGDAHGRFDGEQWGLRIGAGMPRTLAGGVKITPQATLELSDVEQDSYTESRGGALALRVGGNHAERFRTGLGVEVSRDTLLSNETTIELYVRTFWNRDLKDDGVRTGASFVSGGSAFSAPGKDVERDTFRTGIGCNVYSGEGFTASIGYDLTLSGQSVSQVPQLTVRWEF